jgi:spore maturation protein CgeB
MNHKVLVIGTTSPGALPESYARAFERLGMEVIRYDFERAILQAGRFTGNRILRRALRPILWNAVNREVSEVAQNVRPAFIFGVKCSFLHPETVRQIRRSVGVPFVNHYPDHPYIGVRWNPREPSALRRDLIEALRQYSVVFMWERTLVERLRRDGVEAKYLPFAVDPELCQPKPGNEGLVCKACNTTHEVAFVATYTRFRCTEISAARRHTVAIWGNNWPRKWMTLSGQHRVHAPVWGGAVGDIYARGAVSLNVLNAENLGGPNMRTFEVPGSGGVMLARYSPAQDEFFPENEAAVYYRSPAEIDDKIEWLLGDGELRARLRKNAARLAAKQTYDVRAAQVLRECGIDISTTTSSKPSSTTSGRVTV